MPKNTPRRWSIITALVVFATFLAGCSASTGSSSQSSASKRIVAFLPSSSYAYLVDYVNAAKAEAKARGYELTVYENNFDQSAEDQQVQQVADSGDHPAGFLFWPSNPQAAVNSTRQLSRIAPVVQLNAQVLPAAKSYVKAFAGPDDVTVGRIAGQMALQARTEAVASGRLAKDAPGGLIELAFPEVYTPGAARTQGFAEATKSAPFTVLRKEFVGTDAKSGFAAANTLIPQYRSRGLNFIYVHNAELAVGVARALRQNGLVPGKDVTVVVGDGNSGKSLLANGEVYSVVVQSANIDGTLAVRSMAQLLETGKVQPGRADEAPDKTMPAYTATPPHEATFLPLVGVTAKDAPSLKLWGFDFPHLLS